MGSSKSSLALTSTAVLSALSAIGLLAGCSSSEGDSPAQEGTNVPREVEHLSVSIKEHTAMLPNSFTQGLEVDPEGMLLVGTGLYGQSRLLRLEPGAKAPEQEVSLPPSLFGEGITQTQDAIWQLTWKAGEAIKRDPVTFEETGRARYEGEGWGLCAAGEDKSELIMSDGSNELRHLDAQTFEETAPRTPVTLEGQSVEEINELECVDGQVFANVWMSEDILRIDPTSGEVTAVIDAAGLNKSGPQTQNDVLNGIAHIPGTEEFWITGKRWVDLYRVTFE